ncbi:MAG: flagellar hook-basal body complex protein FliE [Cellvibrionaceae bacterium]
MSDRMDINRVLVEMRALKAQTQTSNPLDRPIESTDSNPLNKGQSLRSVDETPSFGHLLDQAVNKVNDLQKTSNSMATAFEQGQSGVDITDVMIASQKASVSFQAMLQVRNKLVDAYRDVMNMPV